MAFNGASLMALVKKNAIKSNYCIFEIVFKAKDELESATSLSEEVQQKNIHGV